MPEINASISFFDVRRVASSNFTLSPFFISAPLHSFSKSLNVCPIQPPFVERKDHLAGQVICIQESFHSWRKRIPPDRTTKNHSVIGRHIHLQGLYFRHISTVYLLLSMVYDRIVIPGIRLNCFDFSDIVPILRRIISAILLVFPP